MTAPVPIYTIDLVQADLEPPTVVLRGEFDLASVPELTACFERVLATNTAAINVDLAAVSFIDSAALGALLDAFRKLRDRDGRLVVTTASAVAVRTFDIAGLAPLLPAGLNGDSPRPG